MEFRFVVEESVYISRWSTPGSFVTQFGTVISLCLSIIAVMKVTKIGFEFGLDTYLIRRSKKKKEPVPLDVLLRRATLVEDR